MKTVLLSFMILFASLTVSANDASGKTEASWVASPECKECPKYATPGKASLGNAKGVYRPDKKTKKNSSTTPTPADTTQ